MSVQTKQSLLLLFDRPLEPIFFPKGESKVVFDVPDEYLSERFRPVKQQFTENVSNRFGQTKTVTIQGVDIPDLSFPLSLARDENFSVFIPRHSKMAGVLINAMMKPKTLEELRSLAVYIRERANPFMFFYAYSVVLLHRNDTKNLRLPSFAEFFPEKYIDPSVFNKAKTEAAVFTDPSKRVPITIPRDYTASDLDEEHRVAYFREDLGINLHHWHWHLVYPAEGDREIIDKDRRGELFYYMHQQVLARYNFERFSNNLARTKRLLNFRDPIPEGYFPKLNSLVASKNWPGRTPNTILSDINRKADPSNRTQFDIHDLERWRDRFYQAIHTGSIITNDGTTKQLGEMDGINDLGNMMEASPVLSPNFRYYGNLHNYLHMVIAFSHDPDFRHLESFSILGDTATAMRDPAFYRLHSFVDDIFQEFKNSLPRYREDQLDFSGVVVKSAEINVQGQPKNLLLTLWQESDVDMSRGLDFAEKGSVFARFTHLQHLPFSYKIQVENSGKERQGTVRIFLAPKFDERGIPFTFEEQKNLFIEMDKFVVTLKPKTNNFERKSSESSVVIPFESTFRNLQAGRVEDENTASEQFNFCGCGWPEHMLVPKGTSAGMLCELFVMVSDYEEDKVELNPNARTCKKEAASYCGLRDNKYPDKRSMGYPFDRMPRTGVEDLKGFLTPTPNMFVTDVTIKFTERTIPAKTK